MADLSLRERLQPSLFDRLADDERLLVLYEISTEPATLTRLRISERDLVDILTAQGLTAQGLQTRAHSEPARPQSHDRLVLSFVAPNGRIGPAQIKSLVLKPPGAPAGITLQSFCTIEARNVINDGPESGDRRYASMRRLREYVCRDLASLLNSTGLGTTIDLERYPEVARSVLNYGMPPLTGRTAAGVEPARIARIIEEVIRRFEPRLTRVQVLPDEARDAGGDNHVLSFRIDADLWGQPMPQHLVLRTRISTESGDVSVIDAGAK
jgi:type VI secretion system protein ImpF